MIFINAYETLKIKESASLDEIKISWRKMRSIYHPDKGGDGELFNRIKWAWETLSSKEKRYQHDQDIKHYKSGNFKSISTDNKNLLYTYNLNFNIIKTIINNGGHFQILIDDVITDCFIKINKNELIVINKQYDLFNDNGILIGKILILWEWPEKWSFEKNKGICFHKEISFKKINNGSSFSFKDLMGNVINIKWNKRDKESHKLWIRVKNKGWKHNDYENNDLWVLITEKPEMTLNPINIIQNLLN